MPRTAQHRAEHLAALLPALLVAAERTAATVAQGAHGRRRTGPGETFWQYRRAMPGDGDDAIDWRRSGRSDHLYVRETEWAAAQTVWLDADNGEGMDWRSTPALPTKGERALVLMLALAALLLRAGERVAPLDGSLPPSGGLHALSRLGEALVARDGMATAGALPRHATLVMAGDFLAPLDDTAARIAGLAGAGGRGHLLQVLDPAEESLPYGGRVRFEGLDGADSLLARRAETLRPAYAERLAAHRDGLAAIARHHGWSFATHRTDQPPQWALLALHARLSGGRGRI